MADQQPSGPSSKHNDASIRDTTVTATCPGCGNTFEVVAGESQCRTCREVERKAWQKKQRAAGCEDFSAWYPREKEVD